MQGLLISGGAMFITIWNYNHFDNILVTYLYRINSHNLRQETGTSERLIAPLTNPIDYICDKLPKKCKRC